MQRTNIYLDEHQRRALRDLADRRGAPVAGLIREAIDSWLSAQGVTVLDEDEWQARFAALLERRQQVADRLDIPQEETGADVAEAVRRVRSTPAARRP